MHKAVRHIGLVLCLGLLAGCAANHAASSAALEEAKATVAVITRTQSSARTLPELREAERLLEEAEVALEGKEFTKVRELSLRAVERAKAAQLRAELLDEVERVKEAVKEATKVAERAASLAEVAEAKAEAVRQRIAKTEEEVTRLAAMAQPEKAEPEEEASPEEPAEAEQEEKPAEVKVMRYIVKEGETLWGIAGDPEIYGNNLAWPLIYEANQEAIQREGGIRPGQVLLILKDVPEEKMRQAVQEAIRLMKTKQDWLSGIGPSPRPSKKR